MYVGSCVIMQAVETLQFLAQEHSPPLLEQYFCPVVKRLAAGARIVLAAYSQGTGLPPAPARAVSLCAVIPVCPHCTRPP